MASQSDRAGTKQEMKSQFPAPRVDRLSFAWAQMAAGFWKGVLKCCFVASLFWAAAVHAVGTNEFLARIYTNTTHKTLRYRLLLPKHYDAKNAYPVILYLHGAAARGSDNAEPLNWGPLLWLDELRRGQHNFILVVPQCPSNSGWVEVTGLGLGSLRESSSLKLALEVVTNALPKEFNVDPQRRSLTGVSMGGQAVWVLLNRRPGLFAAAVPVCAPADPGNVTNAAAQTPVWVFHSDDDHLVTVQDAREMVKIWRARGGNPKYTEYTGVKHSSWKKAYAENEMYDWLFTQQLP